MASPIINTIKYEARKNRELTAEEFIKLGKNVDEAFAGLIREEEYHERLMEEFSSATEQHLRDKIKELNSSITDRVNLAEKRARIRNEDLEKKIIEETGKVQTDLALLIATMGENIEAAHTKMRSRDKIVYIALAILALFIIFI